MLKKIYYYYSFFVYLGVVFVRNYALNRNKIKGKTNLESYDVNIAFWIGAVNMWLLFIVFYPLFYWRTEIPEIQNNYLFMFFAAKILAEITWYVSLGKFENVVKYFDNFLGNCRVKLIINVSIIWLGVFLITSANCIIYIIRNW